MTVTKGPTYWGIKIDFKKKCQYETKKRESMKFEESMMANTVKN